MQIIKISCLTSTLRFELSNSSVKSISAILDSQYKVEFTNNHHVIVPANLFMAEYAD